MKKKIFITLGIVLALALVTVGMVFFYFTEVKTKTAPEGLSASQYRDWVAKEVYKSIYTHDMVDIGYKLPSHKKLSELKAQTDLTRNYPKKVNAIFEIGANQETLVHLSGELKDLGVNTYFVHSELVLKNGKIKLFDPLFFPQTQDKAERSLKHRFLLAKQKGLAVGFIPDYFNFFHFGKEKYQIDKLEPQYIDIALKWARIAEEYGVEYFVPINEYEKLLESNGYDLDFVYKRTNAFYKKLMPQLRKIYSGKIIIKTGYLGDWKNHANLDLSSGDYFGVGTFYALSKENIRRDVKDMVKEIDKVSQKQGVPWLVTEYLVATAEDIKRDFPQGGVQLDMKDAYEAGLNELRKAKRLAGFTFTGYIGTGKIRGTGAVLLLKNFYKNY